MSQSSSDPSGERSGTAHLSDSEVHRILASDRRRALLSGLEDRSMPRDLEELASLVAEHEAGVDGSDPGSIHRVAISLHHHHLPKLAEVGLLEYDPRSRQIRSYEERDRLPGGIDSFEPV